MKILGIETSTFSGSVALLIENNLLGEYTLNIGPMHNETLVPSIDNLLKNTGIKKEELDGVAVSVGPGSFTSLRVGVSTAKAFAYSLNIKIVGISSLDILAYSLFGCEFQICPIIDAKKKQLFYAFYENHDNFEVKSKESLAEPHDIFNSIQKETIFIGNGVEVYKDLIIDELGDKAKFPPSIFHIGRASCCAVLGREKFLNDFEDNCFNLAPLYLRKSEAELKHKGK